MAKVLVTNPTVVAFGPATVDRIALSDLYIVNDGNEDLDVTGLSFGTAKFDTVTAVPFTLPALGNFQIKIRFLPVSGDEGTLLSDTLTITHDGDNGPTTTVAVSGRGGDSPAAFLGFSPSSWSFDWVDGRNLLDGINVGEQSNVTNILLINYGDTVLTLEKIFPIASGVRILSAPSLPYALQPASTTLVSLSIEAELSGLQSNLELFGVFTNAQFEGLPPTVFIHSFFGSYTGIALVSIGILNGTVRKTLAAFEDVIRQVDDSDLEVEQTARLVKTLDLGLPYQEKFLSRLRVRYEDIGQAELQVQVVTVDGTTTVTPNVSIGTVGADGKIREALADLLVSERVFELRVTHVSGPVSIVDIGIEYEPQGAAITTE